MTAIVLSPFDLILASALVLLSAGLSLILSLRVQNALLISATRMVVQLVLVGLVLRFIFGSNHPLITLGIVLIMLVAASNEVGARGSRRLTGWWHFGAGAISITATTVPIVLVVLATALRPTPWYDARHALPLVGIVLGTVMNAASLALNSLLTAAARDRLAIEARLALGATKRDAFQTLVSDAVRNGIMPTVNQMSAAGIITMPGIMTGQVLAGMDPLDAAKYQILLMFVLSASGFFGALIASRAALARLTDNRHRLRLDRLRAV